MSNELGLTTVIAEAQYVTTMAQGIQVNDEGALVEAVSFLGRVKTALMQVNVQRDFLVRPLKAHISDIDAMFKPILEPLEAANKLVRGRVDDWKRAEGIRIAEQKRQEAEAAAARLAVAKAQGEATDEQVQALSFVPDRPDTPIRRVNTQEGAAQFRKVWKYRIINEAAIPRDYLIPNPAKIEEAKKAYAVAVKDNQFAYLIPGVEFYQADQLAVSESR